MVISRARAEAQRESVTPQRVGLCHDDRPRERVRIRGADFFGQKGGRDLEGPDWYGLILRDQPQARGWVGMNEPSELVFRPLGHVYARYETDPLLRSVFRNVL